MSFSSYAIPFLFFVILASPAAFKMTQGVLGGGTVALLIHALLFVILVGFFMRRTSGFTTIDQANEKGYLRYQERQFII